MEYLNDIIFSEASIYLGIIAIVMSVISLLTIIEQWILFNKLGEKGWKSLIPIYNNWVYLKLGDLPGWLIILPIANAIGLIVASFNIPKKLNKSAALGILYLISPNIYYLVLIFSKNNQKNKKINEVVASNIEQASSPTENKVEERIPEFVEAPALNTEETKIPDVTKLNNAYINITPETSTVSKEPKYDEDITSAFEMPIPEPNAKTNQTEELVDTLTKLKQSDLNLDINNEPTLELETLETNKVPTVDNDILEETVELPKMVNEEINSGLNVTKHCNNCGFENEYSQKNCLMCGAPLE